MFTVRIEDSFAAAHYLTQYQGKCENMHGHNYRVRVTAEGQELDEAGMLVDFGILKSALAEVLKEMDHTLLNEHPEFLDGRPSAERIARYIFHKIQEMTGAPISRVEVFETERNAASYVPD